MKVYFSLSVEIQVVERDPDDLCLKNVSTLFNDC